MKDIDISVKTDLEIKKQGDLFGIFFEDLNHAADGGLYGELVRNRSFEFDAVDAEGYHSLTAWEKVERGDSVVSMHVESHTPLNHNNPHYLVLEVLTGGGEGGIRNEGYCGGIPVRKGETYIFSCFYRLRKGNNTCLKIYLENEDGKPCCTQDNFFPRINGWQRYECILTAEETSASARLSLLGSEPVSIEFDMISLFPENTYKQRRNGLRADIAEMLADMKPRFLRFPGGCLTHIGSLNAEDRCAMYRWKNTLGAVQERPARRNTWNYNQTLGLGFYELFLFCEDIGAQPFPVISAGYDPHFLRMAEPEEMQEWIDEALDLIEFANGTPDTRWGAIRAWMGHPESFHMKYLGIGNEEVGEGFFERYEIILNAVKDKYPEIEVTGSAGPGSAGSEFDRGWEQARRTRTSYMDEHFYQCPEWFQANADRYENYPKGPRAFLGEYASKKDAWKNACMEAAFMTGMEKAEGVALACYAPLLCNTGYTNWMPNLIYFDNHRIYASPSYYVQKLFMVNQGDALLETCDDIIPVKKDMPDLSGSIRMKTQQACVEFRQFRVTEGNGTVSELPDFLLSEDRQFSEKLETKTSYYRVSFRFCRKNGGRAASLNGSKSFELEFAGKDELHRLIWRFDGWQRLTSLGGVYQGEECDMGLAFFEIKTGCEYAAELVVEGEQVSVWIDGKQYLSHRCRSAQPDLLYYSAVRDVNGDIIVKAVNTQPEEKKLYIHLENESLRGKVVRISAIQGYAPEARNSMECPENVVPSDKTELCPEDGYTCFLQGYSLVVLRFVQA